MIGRRAGKSDFGTLETTTIIPSPRRSPPRTQVQVTSIPHTVPLCFALEAVWGMSPEAMRSKSVEPNQHPSPGVARVGPDPEMVYSESVGVSKTCCDTGPNDMGSVTRADGAEKDMISRPPLTVELDVVDGLFRGPCLFTDEDDNAEEE